MRASRFDARSDAALVTAATAALRSEMQQRRQLEAELLGAVEGRTSRIGQDLHDDLCQRLGATAMMTSAIGIRIAPQDSQAAAELEKIAKMTSDSMKPAVCLHGASILHPGGKGSASGVGRTRRKNAVWVRVHGPAVRELCFHQMLLFNFTG
jgi:hypothetical protein